MTPSKEVPMPVVVAITLVILAVIGVVAWKVFAAPPAGGAGSVTAEQAAEKLKQNREHPIQLPPGVGMK